MGRKMIEEKFLNKSKFTEIVEETVIEKQLSYMDAVLYICEMNSIDLEDVKKFISPIIKGKIEAEAMALNFLPKQNTLF
jgi:vacuolar-type H+-ATPase catalytic subunit A/Vma1